MQEPKTSRWGAVQTCDCLVTGNLYWVTTASHGGIILSKGFNRKIPKDGRQDDRHYEEDCDWAIAVTFLSKHFTGDILDEAKKTLKQCYWKIYERVYGEIPEGESFSKDDYLFHARNTDKWQVLSCLCHDHPTLKAKEVEIPEDTLAVWACKGGREDGYLRSVGAWFVVPRADYQNPSRMTWADGQYPKLYVNI